MNEQRYATEEETKPALALHLTRKMDNGHNREKVWTHGHRTPQAVIFSLQFSKCPFGGPNFYENVG